MMIPPDISTKNSAVAQAEPQHYLVLIDSRPLTDPEHYSYKTATQFAYYAKIHGYRVPF